MKNSITDLLVLRSNSVARLVLPMQWARWRHPFTLYRTLFVPCRMITLYRTLFAPCRMITLYRTLFVPCRMITLYRTVFVPCTQTSHCAEHCSYPAQKLYPVIGPPKYKIYSCVGPDTAIAGALHGALAIKHFVSGTWTSLVHQLVLPAMVHHMDRAGFATVTMRPATMQQCVTSSVTG